MVGKADLFGADPLPEAIVQRSPTVPRGFIQLAENVIQANDPERFALLYHLLWRLNAGEKHLMELSTDPQLRRAMALAKSVRRDTHKMRAFLRFREVQGEGQSRYVAWFEPEHFIVEANAGFFQRRFASMNWVILTPYRSLRWDGETLLTGPGADKTMVPEDDAMKEYWDTYFTSIFNPARLKVSAMTSEMPRKYWKNLPEAALIPELIQSAAYRTKSMIDSAK